ncbi:MAG: hypothetical protein ACXAEU_10925 [Candidatus Hodarchaeales archaeon]|jgi:hypothetical protein
MKEFKQVITDKPEIGIVLHAYQPPYPIQTPDIVDRIVNNTYIPVPLGLLEAKIPITVNISASLSEILEVDFPEVIEGFVLLYEEGLLEFLGSGAYHPILPMLPLDEVKKQIKMNEKINKRVFGKYYDPIGFFPPELAISENMVPLLKELEYKYIMMPNTSVHGVTSKKPFYRIKGLIGVTRDKEVSNRMSFRGYKDEKAFINHVTQQQFYYQSPTVLAMDIETFGEHHSGYYGFLLRCLSKCKMSKIQDLIAKEKIVTPLSTFKDSSWSTSIDDTINHNSFPLWDNPNNSLHQLQNLHVYLVNYLAGIVLNNDVDSEIAKLVAQSQTSCQFWWATSGQFSKELIIKGIQLQRKALEALMKNYPEQQAIIWLDISDKIIERLKKSLDIKLLKRS